MVAATLLLAFVKLNLWHPQQATEWRASQALFLDNYFLTAGLYTAYHHVLIDINLLTLYQLHSGT